MHNGPEHANRKPGLESFVANRNLKLPSATLALFAACSGSLETAGGRSNVLNYRVPGYGLPGDPVDSSQGQLRFLQMCTKILINWVLRTRDVNG